MRRVFLKISALVIMCFSFMISFCACDQVETPDKETLRDTKIEELNNYIDTLDKTDYLSENTEKMQEAIVEGIKKLKTVDTIEEIYATSENIKSIVNTVGKLKEEDSEAVFLLEFNADGIVRPTHFTAKLGTFLRYEYQCLNGNIRVVSTSADSWQKKIVIGKDCNEEEQKYHIDTPIQYAGTEVSGKDYIEITRYENGIIGGFALIEVLGPLYSQMRIIKNVIFENTEQSITEQDVLSLIKYYEQVEYPEQDEYIETHKKYQNDCFIMYLTEEASKNDVRISPDMFVRYLDNVEDAKVIRIVDITTVRDLYPTDDNYRRILCVYLDSADDQKLLYAMLKAQDMDEVEQVRLVERDLSSIGEKTYEKKKPEIMYYDKGFAAKKLCEISCIGIELAPSIIEADELPDKTFFDGIDVVEIKRNKNPFSLKDYNASLSYNFNNEEQYLNAIIELQRNCYVKKVFLFYDFDIIYI